MALPVAPTFANGLTTWITDNDNVLQSWMNPQLSKTAKFLKDHIPKLFEAIQASKPKPVFEIDCGSDDPSLRVLSYKNGAIMSKKVEVNWGSLDKSVPENMCIGEIGFIAELIKTYPQAIFDIRATAWARLEAGDKERERLLVDRRLERLNGLNGASSNVRFRVISQQEEAEGATLSLQNMLKLDPAFAKGFQPNGVPVDPARAKSVDGGNRSNQGTDFSVDFGGANVKEWIATDGVLGAIKKCHFKLLDAFQHVSIKATPEDDFIFFAGNHISVLTKNEEILKYLDIPYTTATVNGKPVHTPSGNEWHAGLRPGNVHTAINKQIQLQERNYEAAVQSNDENAKDAALSDLGDLIVTSQLMYLYLIKSISPFVRIGEYKNNAGEVVKITHYLGGYIKDFVIPFFQNAANNTFRQKFLRFLARRLDI